MKVLPDVGGPERVVELDGLGNGNSQAHGKRSMEIVKFLINNTEIKLL